MSKPRSQLSRIKTANLPYIAAEVEKILKDAPGNTSPTPLELADAEISRCGYCGAQHVNERLCNSCKTNGFPVINSGGTA